MVRILVRKTCTCSNEIPVAYESKNTGSEPVSSTSRRGTRAAYHDEYRQDFGPRIAYTVSLVSGTCRQPGRERHALRPYETDPFHPLALFMLYSKLYFHIFTWLLHLFVPRGIYTVSCKIVHLTHAFLQQQLFRRR